MGGVGVVGVEGESTIDSRTARGAHSGPAAAALGPCSGPRLLADGGGGNDNSSGAVDAAGGIGMGVGARMVEAGNGGGDAEMEEAGDGEGGGGEGGDGEGGDGEDGGTNGSVVAVAGTGVAVDRDTVPSSSVGDLEGGMGGGKGGGKLDPSEKARQIRLLREQLALLEADDG